MGPLSGIRVIEFSGLGPGPFCGMLLADMGAEVLRIDRPGHAHDVVNLPPRLDFQGRNKKSLGLDLKSSHAHRIVMGLVKRADILIEGFRPGAMERLGLGPDECLARNPRLVYGRMTGWGQDGPLRDAVGHDLNYIAITGALDAIGQAHQKPTIPLNLLGDFGGGALYLAMGVLAALLESRNSGRGQVVDAAMVDGITSLMTLYHALSQGGIWGHGRGENLMDGGAPFYDVYETRDGRHIAVAAFERRFYTALIDSLGLGAESLPPQYDRAGWDELRARLSAEIKTRTRDEWCSLFEGTDACVSPVLSLEECRKHPHLVARTAFTTIDGVFHPTPAPRFSRTASEIRHGAPARGTPLEVLRDWGFDESEIVALLGDGADSSPASSDG